MLLLESDLSYTDNWAEILKNPETGEIGIKCLDCGTISWWLNYVSEWFCPICNAYHNPDLIKLDSNLSDNDIEEIKGIVSYNLLNLLK